MNLQALIPAAGAGIHVGDSSAPVLFGGSYGNLKIATPEDVRMVEALLAADPLCA